LIEFNRVGGATNISRSAVEEGVLRGRRLCPLARHPVAGQFINDDKKTGIDIVRHALVTPAKQIIDNAGGVGAVVICKQFGKNWLSLGNVRDPYFAGND